MSRALTATLVAFLLIPTAAFAAEPSRKRDKGCAKGASFIDKRQGTIRMLFVARDGSLRFSVCDTRYGRIVPLRLPGSNRSDGAARVLARAGARAVFEGRRTHPRGPTQARMRNFVDLKTGRRIVLENPVRAYAFLGVRGVFGYVHHGVGARELRVLSLDGREDTAGFAPVASALTFRRQGTTVTFGPRDAPVTVDYAAMVARLRVCQPGRTGTASARTYISRDDATIRIWTDDKGITRACPPAPTGELGLPCPPADFAFAAPRLVIHCKGSPDSVAILDTGTRALVATHPLGGTNLTARVAVSSERLVAYTGRTDGASGQANVLYVITADGAAPQAIAEAGYSIRNVRFTAPRTLAWAEVNRQGGPDVNKTQAF